MAAPMTPFIEQRADPFICKHSDGYYYFTASLPAFDAICLRRSKTLAGLREAAEKVVWTKHPSGEMSMNIWAPEIHYLKGKWYIYFAAAQADADGNGCYDHRTYVLENSAANPLEGHFVEKARLFTGWESFTLDATVFSHHGSDYMVWAQRDYAIRGNSNLYLARMLDPWTLQLPAALLTNPEYDWECQGFLVNEGPAVLKKAGKIYITYSGSATDERYAMGLLTADAQSDLTAPASWTKSPVPVMVSEPENGLFGPGHNSFTVDENGQDILVFHARPYPGFRGTALSDPNRHCFLRRVVYDAQERPIFTIGDRL